MKILLFTFTILQFINFQTKNIDISSKDEYFIYLNY